MVLPQNDARLKKQLIHNYFHILTFVKSQLIYTQSLINYQNNTISLNFN